MEKKFMTQDFDRNIVYVKEVHAQDLPDDVLAEIGQDARMFAVHDADGEQLALVTNRTIAFDLARENQLVPVNVH